MKNKIYIPFVTPTISKSSYYLTDEGIKVTVDITDNDNTILFMVPLRKALIQMLNNLEADPHETFIDIINDMYG